MNQIHVVILLLLSVGSNADGIYKCDPPLNSEVKAKECAMWHSRVISELSISGYSYDISENDVHWIVVHTNLDDNGSSYKVVVNKENGKLVKLGSK